MQRISRRARPRTSAPGRLLKNGLLVRGMDAPGADQSRKRLIRRSRTRTCAGSGASKKVRMTFFNILPESQE